MPGTGNPQRHLLVHQLLNHAHALLCAAEDDEAPSLVALLASAADHLRGEDGVDLDPPALAWVVAEAAGQLLACTRTPVGAGDPNLGYCLQALDQLPRSARTGLLAAAARRTTPDTDGTPPPSTARVFAPDRQPTAPHRTPGRCPCSCNDGGFCGGCAHAGCGGRQ
ncbi:hypothetical protein [Streptomyces bluensis]|uniref:Uncharacterized protein n=1 Tax=Streptomyces bluensis TaxID=33897 RepID=A0ABW6UTD1_9ACTN